MKKRIVRFIYIKEKRIQLIMEKKKVLLGLIPVVIIAVLAVIFFVFKPQTTTGSKKIEIEVVNDSGEIKTYDVKTDAEYLRQAMEEAEGLEFSGEESEYGMMITEINGVVADYNADQSYWAFYINGDFCNYGIEKQPVTDGDVFRIEYTK